MIEVINIIPDMELSDGSQWNIRDRSEVLVAMIRAERAPRDKWNDIAYSLDNAKNADRKLSNSSEREEIKKEMERDGQAGPLNKLVKYSSQRPVKIMFGGGYLTVPKEMLATLFVKNTIEHDGRIYGMLTNGAEDSLFIIEEGEMRIPSDTNYDKSSRSSSTKERQSEKNSSREKKEATEDIQSPTGQVDQYLKDQ